MRRRGHEAFLCLHYYLYWWREIVKFWHSPWSDGLKTKYMAPSILAVSKQKNFSVHKALDQDFWIRNLSFEEGISATLISSTFGACSKRSTFPMTSMIQLCGLSLVMTGGLEKLTPPLENANSLCGWSFKIVFGRRTDLPLGGGHIVAFTNFARGNWWQRRILCSSVDTPFAFGVKLGNGLGWPTLTSQ